MTVWFGATPADYVTGGTTFTVFADSALTVPATGLVDETGAAITNPAANVVTARASGFSRFGAPNGTKVLYTSDGKGSFLRLLPDADAAYATKPTGTPTAGQVPTAQSDGSTAWATPAAAAVTKTAVINSGVAATDLGGINAATAQGIALVQSLIFGS